MSRLHDHAFTICRPLALRSGWNLWILHEKTVFQRPSAWTSSSCVRTPDKDVSFLNAYVGTALCENHENVRESTWFQCCTRLNHMKYQQILFWSFTWLTFGRLHRCLCSFSLIDKHSVINTFIRNICVLDIATYDESKLVKWHWTGPISRTVSWSEI